MKGTNEGMEPPPRGKPGSPTRVEEEVAQRIFDRHQSRMARRRARKREPRPEPAPKGLTLSGVIDRVIEEVVAREGSPRLIHKGLLHKRLAPLVEDHGLEKVLAASIKGVRAMALFDVDNPTIYLVAIVRSTLVPKQARPERPVQRVVPKPVPVVEVDGQVIPASLAKIRAPRPEEPSGDLWWREET